MVNKIALFFLTIFFISFISPVQDGWGQVKQDDCINLVQTCANCTYVNITSINLYQNSSSLLGEVSMVKSGTEYNYTFCDTSQLGVYLVNGKGDPDGTTDTWVAQFEVTPTGNLLNSSQATLYLFMLIVFIALFILSSIGAIKVGYQNIRSNNEEIISVNWKKYLKMFCIGFSYFLLIVIVWFAWNISYGYLQMRGLGTVFRYLYTLLIVISMVLFPVIIIMSIVSFVRDRKIEDKLNRGLEVFS